MTATPGSPTGPAPPPIPAVLFVDDEPNVLSGLRRMLRTKNGQWRMSFANGGEDALRMMGEAHFDAIVSDMRMPRMDGAELLATVEQRHPEAIRIILSGQCDQEGALRSVGPSHMFLSKPCEADLLVATVDRALSLRRLIFDERTRSALAGLRALPSLPNSYHEIRRAIEDPNCSFHKIAKAVEHDPAVAAALLHVANSAYFAPRREITSITQAVGYLGLDVVRAVVLSSGVIKQLGAGIVDAAWVESVWNHSLRVANATRAIIHALDDQADPRRGGEAYTAGLLHDVGLLALAAAFPPDDARPSISRHLSECARAKAEMAIHGVDHGAIGGYLMGLWGLPDPIVEAITYHHHPDDCFDPGALLPHAVAIASGVEPLATAKAPIGDIIANLVAEEVVSLEESVDPRVGGAIAAAVRACQS